MIEIIIERILHIGEIPLCNGIPSRALHIGNFVLFYVIGVVE